MGEVNRQEEGRIGEMELTREENGREGERIGKEKCEFENEEGLV